MVFMYLQIFRVKKRKSFYPFCPMTISFHAFLYLFVPLHRVLIINYPLSIRTALLGQNGPLLSAIHFDIYLRFDKKNGNDIPVGHSPHIKIRATSRS